MRLLAALVALALASAPLARAQTLLSPVNTDVPAVRPSRPRAWPGLDFHRPAARRQALLYPARNLA